MKEGLAGYLAAAWVLFVMYKTWIDPFHLDPEIRDWDDVTDENRSAFTRKRLLAACGGLLLVFVAVAFAKEITSKVRGFLDYAIELTEPLTIDNYDCDDVASEVKNQEFRNAFGAVYKVILVRESIEIERSDTKLSCQMTSLLSNGNEVSMISGFEEIDGEIYIRSSIDD